MNEFVMDADSNSWGSDYDQGEDYGSDYSDSEYQPAGAAAASSHHQHHHLAGPSAATTSSASGRAPKSKSAANARKMVNRGRWTKDEARPPKSSTFFSLEFLFNFLFFFPSG